MIESQNKNTTSDDTLSFIQECPVCECHFDMDGVQVLQQRDNASLVHITCHECKSSVLAVVLMTEVGTSSLGILTDLEPEDVSRQISTEPITHDKVLDLHLSLQEENKFETAIISAANT